MTDFKNRFFRIIPDNEGKILTLGCMFKELKGMLICEATEEEKKEYFCGTFMTYPIVGEGYDVWDNFKDFYKGLENSSIGKKGETIPIINLEDAFRYNAKHYVCDFYDILIDAEKKGVTITNRFDPDSEELLPDTITLYINQYSSCNTYSIASVENNYYIPMHDFCISQKDNQLHVLDYRKKDGNKEWYELVETIGDIVWSYKWFFNRKQIRVQIKTYSEDGGWINDQLIDLPKDWPEIILNLENNINDYVKKPWNKESSDHWGKKRPDTFKK